MSTQLKPLVYSLLMCPVSRQPPPWTLVASPWVLVYSVSKKRMSGSREDAYGVGWRKKIFNSGEQSFESLSSWTIWPWARWYSCFLVHKLEDWVRWSPGPVYSLACWPCQGDITIRSELQVSWAGGKGVVTTCRRCLLLLSLVFRTGQQLLLSRWAVPAGSPAHTCGFGQDGHTVHSGLHLSFVWILVFYTLFFF